MRTIKWIFNFTRNCCTLLVILLILTLAYLNYHPEIIDEILRQEELMYKEDAFLEEPVFGTLSQKELNKMPISNTPIADDVEEKKHYLYQKDQIKFKVPDGFAFVPIHDILYVEAGNPHHKVFTHLSKDTILVSKRRYPLTKLKNTLDTDNSFFKTKKHLFNCNHIRKLRTHEKFSNIWQVELVNGKIETLPNNRHKDLLEILDRLSQDVES